MVSPLAWLLLWLVVQSVAWTAAVNHGKQRCVKVEYAAALATCGLRKRYSKLYSKLC